jgi:uncharacterized protein YukE
MPAPITATTIPVTQQAQGDFQNAVTSLRNISNQVNSSNSALGQAMISDSGTIYRQRITQWNGDLNDIINTLQQMTNQLEATWQQIQSNEQHNQDLASGVSIGSLP